MNISQTLIAVLFAIISFPALGQGDPVFMTNSKPIDEKRYEGIKSSPYYFDDWVVGNVIDKSGNAIAGVLINYNGYSDNIEIRKGDRFIELDTKEYTKVEVLTADNPKKLKAEEVEAIVFKGKVHPRFKNRIVQVIYEGDNVSLINDFDIVLSTKEVNNVGKAIEFKQFVKRNTYYLLKGEELKVVKLNRRKLLDTLGEQQALTKYMKSERINVTSYADLTKLMAYYEELIK